MTARSRSGATSVETVYRALRCAIVAGDPPPESTLRLSELAARFGVSPIPVREALRLLQADGFVVSTPHDSARVAPQSHGDLHEVYGLRLVLEAEAVRLAVTRFNAIAQRRLERLEREVERTAPGDLIAGIAADRALHTLIWETGGSQRLLDLADLIWDHAERYRRTAASGRPQPKADHRALLDAMSERDIDRAAATIRTHLSEELSAVEIGFLTVSPTDPRTDRLVPFPKRLPPR